MTRNFGSCISGLKVEASAKAVITLRTNVSVPRAPASRYVVQRQRWFTVVDPDAELIRRAEAFAMVLASIPRVSAQLHYAIAEDISA
jgi:hypothetical protein